MAEILFETVLNLLPGRAGPSQSASYAFVGFNLACPGDARLEEATLELTFSSKALVQLPVALYGPDGRLCLTRADEPAKGEVRLGYLIPAPRGVGGVAGRWKLVIHKRILDAHLSLGISVLAASGPTAASGPAAAPGPALHADTASTAAADAAGFDSAVPDPRPGWYCGEIHLHSDMSTGRKDVATIARVAAERGLDFLGITDHFTPAHWERIEELGAAGSRPLFLRSLELAGDRGHANLHGIASWPDPFPDDEGGAVAAFLGRKAAGSMEEAADLAHAQGGLFCINHPLSAGGAWRYGEFPLEKADLIEVASLPDGPVSFLYPTFWDGLLRQGYRLTGVGSSDSHDPEQDGPWALGRIRNWVRADSLSRRGILAGLASGECYVAVGESRLSFVARISGPGRTEAPTDAEGLAGMEHPMGSTVALGSGETCTLEIGLENHPSGNLFMFQNGFIHDVRYFAENPGRDVQTYTLDTRRLQSGQTSWLRVEYHEDLEKARYHGMAFRDHRSLRLLSNPIYVEVAP